MSSKPTIVSHHLGLPISRVKIIMKSSPDVDHISPDALYAMAKATELFVAHLATEAYSVSEEKEIQYKELADVVNNDDVFGFLQEVIPHKITARQYWKLMTKFQNEINDNSD